MKLNRFSIIFTVLCLFCLLAFGTALADDSHRYNILEDDIRIEKGTAPDTLKIICGIEEQDNIPIAETITIFQKSGSVTSSKVIIDGNELKGEQVTVKIENVNIHTEFGSALALENEANVKLILSGENILKSGTDFNTNIGYAGLNVPENCNILITSPDGEKNILKAIGGQGDRDTGSGSGIGGNGSEADDSQNGGENSGSISIKNAIVYAIGGDGDRRGDGGGSGIGGGGGSDTVKGGSSHSITIENSEIYATGGNSYNTGGGSGIGGGGAGWVNEGGRSELIEISDSKIYAVGGLGRSQLGKEISIYGSGIGGGGGVNHEGQFGNAKGGTADLIKISGENTDIIILKGGIGGGHGDSNGDGRIIIESGNVLILDEIHTGNAFYAADNSTEIYPITFSIMSDEQSEQQLADISVDSTEKYRSKTRENALDKLIRLEWIGGIEHSPLFETGTVTLWLPLGENNFVFNEKIKQTQTIESSNKITEDLMIQIYLETDEKQSNSGTGSATIVDLIEEKPEESKPIVNQNDEKSVESNIDEEKPIVSEQEHEKFPAVILLLMTVLATAVFILFMIQKGAKE